jgi:hypothetical protein
MEGLLDIIKCEKYSGIILTMKNSSYTVINCLVILLNINGGFNMKNCIKILACLAVALFLSSCALGVTKLQVTHDPLAQVEKKKEGNILLKEFKDTREPGKNEYIGNKRNGFGMVLGNVDSTEKLEPLLTKYFAEALENAGYTVVIDNLKEKSVPADFKTDVVIEGDISEFWLDLYMAVWQNIAVTVKALEKDTNKPLWEKQFVGEETNVLWIGANSEFEKVIRQALTKVLNEATNEFASDEFYKSIKTNKKSK